MNILDRKICRTAEEGLEVCTDVLFGDIRIFQDEIDRRWAKVAEWTTDATLLTTYKRHDGLVAQILKVQHGKRPTYLRFIPATLELSKVYAEIKKDENDGSCDVSPF